MKIFYLIAFFLICSTNIFSQGKSKFINGMYVQWGYNTEWYTNSNIHFKMSNGNDFTLHNAKAHDKPDLDAITKKPLEVSIPQYNYRVGFYLNKNQSRAIEINFDHPKYVVTQGQTVHVTGTIDKVAVNGDSVLDFQTFLHLEHTDGANWFHINYVQQHSLLNTNKTHRQLVNFIWKVGAGINIPRTDFTWRGDRLNNKFHVAGYNFGAESGARIYPFKKIFLEFTSKAGYVKYVNALANTTHETGNRVTHSFGYVELIGLIGVDIRF
ncbi:MAG: hypothetical protein ABIW38_09785 [Ferruginibacter sp.]